jgi:hypothetical protein
MISPTRVWSAFPSSTLAFQYIQKRQNSDTEKARPLLISDAAVWAHNEIIKNANRMEHVVGRDRKNVNGHRRDSHPFLPQAMTVSTKGTGRTKYRFLPFQDTAFLDLSHELPPYL